MKPKILNPEKKKLNSMDENFLFDQLSIQQLIDLAIDSHEDKFVEFESRQELLKRGKDNIQARIIIKKSCKNTIANFEGLLKKISTEKNSAVIKDFKNKFLSSVSILDKLQLEWQRHDLGLIK